MKQKVRFLPALAILLFPPVLYAAEVLDRVAVIVNGEIIALSEIKEMAGFLLSSSPSASEEMRKKAMEDAMEQLIAQRIVTDEMTRKGVSVSEKEIESAIQEILAQNRITKEELARELERQGIKFQNYRENLKEQLLRMKFMNQEIRPHVSVTPEAIREAYEESLSSLEGSEEIHLLAMVFLVKTPTPEGMEEARRRAEMALVEVKKGRDFSHVAAEMSDEPTKSQKGELGWSEKQNLEEKIAEVVASLKEGEVSGIVPTTNAFTIIKVAEKRKAGVRSFEEAKEEIEKRLFQEEMERQMELWIKEKKAQSSIEILL